MVFSVSSWDSGFATYQQQEDDTSRYGGRVHLWATVTGKRCYVSTCYYFL